MAYYIRSLQVSNYHLRSLYDTFMVAEHAFTDPRHEDDDETNTECININEQAEHEDKDMKFIGDLMPVDLDPSEAERRIKLEIVKIFAESQNQVRLEMMTVLMHSMQSFRQTSPTAHIHLMQRLMQSSLHKPSMMIM